MERLVLSAAELGFPVPPSPLRLRAALDEVLAAEGMSDGVARITVTRGIPGGRPVRTGAWLEVEPLGGRLWAGTRTRHAEDGGPAGGRVMLSETPFAPGLLGRHKTTSRLAWDLAREEARAAGADEALLVSPAGEVLEGAASNLFVLRDGGELITPPLAADVLPGITRAIVIGLCTELGIRVREAAVPVEVLRRADEAFVTNSVQEVLPLARVEGRTIPGRVLGMRVLTAYRERVAAG
jgi:branched-chain amino acid aminotransferase